MLNFLTARLSASQTCGRRTQLAFLHHNASHIFKSFASVVKLSELNQPTQNQQGDELFTISYLKSSCGLSADVAIELSKRVKLKNSDKPDSVLSLFRSYGFSVTQISKVVKTYTPVLLAKSGTTILPELRFFQPIGFSCSELPEFLTTNSMLFSRSLEKCIIPRYEALKSVLGDNDNVRRIIKITGWNFSFHGVEDLVSNLKVLREHGVPRSSVSQSVIKYPRLAFVKHAKFVESVKFAKETGVEPSRASFISAIYVFSIMKKSTWESKLDIFERCCWSRDLTLLAFRKYPYCMLLSKKKITSLMKFLLNEMGLPLKDIAGCAPFFGYSLEQRIIPRWSVFKLLKTKGLIKNDSSFTTVVILSEKKFLEKFVIRFLKSVPQILNIYKGQLGTSPEVSGR